VLYRGQRGSRAKFDRALLKIAESGQEPYEYDRLPEDGESDA
jgi:hypothetical protein